MVVVVVVVVVVEVVVIVVRHVPIALENSSKSARIVREFLKKVLEISK